MVYINDFIWHEDHMVYHVTSDDHMEGICEKGLLPMCGERSKSVGDTMVGVHFSDSLISIIEDWSELLYKNKDRRPLEILRFNIKERTWITNCQGDYYMPGDWYLINGVLPQYIDYLRINNNGNLEHATDENDLYYNNDNRIWLPIKEYKK